MDILIVVIEHKKLRYQLLICIFAILGSQTPYAWDGYDA